jgi:hypothetical protein
MRHQVLIIQKTNISYSVISKSDTEQELEQTELFLSGCK